MNDLIEIEELNAVEIFSNKGLDDVLRAIKFNVSSVVSDVTTLQGRKEIASLAAKVASSKVALDNAGKDLVSDWKAKSKLVDNERKRSREFLDALKIEVRKPLTDYEIAEKEKEAAERLLIEIQIDHDEAIAMDLQVEKEKDLLRREAELKQKEEAIEKAEQDKKAEEKRKLEAEQIKAKAKADAQAEAQVEIDRANKEKQAAIYEAEQKEADRLKAIEVQKLEDEKRLRNTRHKGAINSQAVNDLASHGIDEIIGKKIITLIAQGKISNVTINY